MQQVALIVISGLAIGLASGIFGIGGGTLMIPLFLYVFKLTMHQAIGTSLLIMVPTALFASTVHMYNKNVVFSIVWGIALFSIIGGILGAYLAPYLSASVLRKGFAIYLMIMAVKLFISR